MTLAFGRFTEGTSNAADWADYWWASKLYHQPRKYNQALNTNKKKNGA